MRLIVNNSNGHAAAPVDTRALPRVSGNDAQAGLAPLHPDDQRAARHLRNLRDALAQADDMRALTRVLAEEIDAAHEARLRLLADQRLTLVVLMAVAATAGYLAGLLHASL